jgi:hypothetical protein
LEGTKQLGKLQEYEKTVFDLRQTKLQPVCLHNCRSPSGSGSGIVTLETPFKGLSHELQGKILIGATQQVHAPTQNKREPQTYQMMMTEMTQETGIQKKTRFS